MVVVARPDVFSAVNLRIRSFTEITAFVASAAGSKSGATTPRVADSIKDDWKMPTHAIRLRARGGSQSDEQIGLLNQRFDVWCYGSNGYEAHRVSRIVAACLMPDQGQHAPSFTLANCRVYDVRSEAEPIEDVDESGWSFYLQPVIVKYGSQPA